jgi:carbamoyltransferase
LSEKKDLCTALDEERFTRVKHDGRFPEFALDYCLKEAGIPVSELDYAGYSWHPHLKWLQKWLYQCYRAAHYFPHFGRSWQHLKQTYQRKKEQNERFLAVKQNLGSGFRGKFVYVRHHTAHAASTYFVSPFDKAAVLVVDAAGELYGTSFYHAQGNHLKALKSFYLPHSLGSFYAAITQYLGFLHHDEEWKVMGWAPYGDPQRYYSQMKTLITHTRHGDYRLNLDYFQHHLGKSPWFAPSLEVLLGKARQKDEDFPSHYADIAAAAQKVLEEEVLTLVQQIKDHTQEKALCLAGGVALNCSMNHKILESGIFEKVYVVPLAHDTGTALGVNLYINHVLNKQTTRFSLDHLYYGSHYSTEILEQTLKSAGLKYRKMEKAPAEIAQLLSEGSVLGFYQGRMEIGPRALGCRSILADPRRKEMKAIINAKIKFREPFRPFAPSVLEEQAGQYFKNAVSSPFMNIVFEVLEEKRSIVPAITHVDHSARIQTVSARTNPYYYAIIQEFAQRTGVPVLLNTSFNIKGEPIVESPANAINCFLGTGLDYLVLDQFLVSKAENSGVPPLAIPERPRLC